MMENNVAEMKKLGSEIFARKVETEYSSYVYEHTKYDAPKYDFEKSEDRKAITSREKDVDDKLDNLTTLLEEKKHVLDDHLARGMKMVYMF